MGLLRYAGLGIFFLLIYMLVLRPVKNQVLATIRALPERAQLPAAAQPMAEPGAAAREQSRRECRRPRMEGELQRELSETNSEVMRAVVLKRHLVEKVKKEPEDATRLIQSWVRQVAGEAMAEDSAPMSGMRKAAILLVVLGDEAASAIYKNLPEEDSGHHAGDYRARLHFARSCGQGSAGIPPPDADAGISGAGRADLRVAAVDEIVRRSGRESAARAGDAGAGRVGAQSRHAAESGPATTRQVHSERASANDRPGAGAYERQGGVGSAGLACRKKCAARP